MKYVFVAYHCWKVLSITYIYIHIIFVPLKSRGDKTHYVPPTSKSRGDMSPCPPCDRRPWGLQWRNAISDNLLLLSVHTLSRGTRNPRTGLRMLCLYMSSENLNFCDVKLSVKKHTNMYVSSCRSRNMKRTWWRQIGDNFTRMHSCTVSVNALRHCSSSTLKLWS